jgi:hypothetical protein
MRKADPRWVPAVCDGLVEQPHEMRYCWRCALVQRYAICRLPCRRDSRRNSESDVVMVTIRVPSVLLCARCRIDFVRAVMVSTLATQKCAAVRVPNNRFGTTCLLANENQPEWTASTLSQNNRVGTPISVYKGLRESGVSRKIFRNQWTPRLAIREYRRTTLAGRRVHGRP